MSDHADARGGSTGLLAAESAGGEQVATDSNPAISRLCDEQSVLLWQASAYAEDLIEVIEAGRDLNPARDALLGFIHYELLPYLRFEEREFADWACQGARRNERQLADHDRIRSGAGSVESSRERRPLMVTTRTLVGRLDRHIRSEQGWAPQPKAPNELRPDPPHWVPPVLGDRVDLDALPVADRDSLVLARLQRMRPGEVFRLRAGADPHSLWCRQHARSPGTHAWVYEREGPSDWLVRVTRRDPGA